MKNKVFSITVLAIGGLICGGAMTIHPLASFIGMCGIMIFMFGLTEYRKVFTNPNKKRSFMIAIATFSMACSAGIIGTSLVV